MKPTLNETLDKVEIAFPGLREVTRTVLAAAATTRLNRDLPLSIILVGGPSSGKTTVLMPLTKGSPDSCLRDGVLRIDDFTTASLVTHAVKKSEEQLKKIDLLPKMKEKVVVVKEMAPLFTGHEDDLARKFGLLASILDGEGHVSGSGSYGTRGYEEKITFTLLGAVTNNVLSQKVYNTLSAIGPRFCFLEMPKRNIDPATWTGASTNRKNIENCANQSVIDFVNNLFERIPAASIEPSSFSISTDLLTRLSNIASLMALLRSKFNYEREEGTNTYVETEPTTESPDRAFRYLEQIIQGSAIIDGRFEIQESDLKAALDLALGSAMPKLRRVANLFFRSELVRSNHDVTNYLRLSDDSAAKYTRQLSDLNVIEKVNPDGTTLWDLKPPFKGLRKIYGLGKEASTEIKPNSTSQTSVFRTNFESL